MSETLDLAQIAPEKLISDVNKAGGQRAYCRKHGVPRVTLQKYLKRAHDARFKSRPVDKAQEAPITKGGVSRFILTSAQDSTLLHEPFLENLERYRNWLNHGEDTCEIMIAGYTYNKSLFEDHAKRKPYWPERIHQYMRWERIRIGDKVDFCAEMNTRPTAEQPLSGFETYTRHRWGIFPHPKVQLKSVATMRDDPAKIIMTTGSVSRPNYVPLRAGIKAQFHHVIGAVLVEIDEEGTFFCRHLISDENGDFFDLDRSISPKGVITNYPVEAINWGDVHVAQIDPVACAISFGIEPCPVPSRGSPRDWRRVELDQDCMLDKLRPKYQFFHDVSDFRARNHHNQRDPHLQFQLYHMDVASVEDELQEVADFLGMTERTFCKSVVVESNHDLALKRWLKEADYRYDPQNALFFLRCQLAMYEAIQSGDDEFSIFEWVVKNRLGIGHDVQFLGTDESFKVFDIEKGMHGHEGANGARGSIAGFTRVGSKATIGHGHSAGAQDGIWAAGTLSKLFLGYNTGLSSWSHSQVVTYSNGKRVIITYNNAKWHL